MKIIKIILISGLILLPFYEGILYLLMPSGKLPNFIDGRVTKEYIAVGLALILTTSVWLEVKKLECPNKWTLFFLVFMFFNMSKSPIGVINPVIDVSLLGNFSAEFKVFAFFLMFCSLASCKFSKEFIDKVFFTMFIGSVVMGGYMILQACNLDQIYKPKPEYFNTDVKGIRVGGFFLQPTLAVPFIVMAIPFAVYFKNKWGVILLSAAALLTGSDFAIVSLLFIFFLYSGLSRKVQLAFIRYPRLAWPMLFGFMILTISAGIYFLKPQGFFNDNGRFIVWTQIFKDVFSGEINGVPVRIGLLGAGLNNFGEIFTAIHNSAYTRAHNEFLQILWCCGVVGEAIFVMINYEVLRTAWLSIQDDRVKTLMISLLVIILCSMGTFVFQLGVYQIFTIVIVSLIYQLKNKSLEIKNV